MTDTMTDDERQAFLVSLGLSDNASETLTVPVTTPAADVPLAPASVDPRTMTIGDIVFDERLLDGFGDLTGENMRKASEHVFALYKSYGRDKDRNGLLHRRITEFIGAVRRSRATGGFVREQVKTTKEQRELAAVMAAKGLTVTDLVALLQSK